MKNPHKEKRFLNKPFYEGGNVAMDKFIRGHLTYPEEALAAKIEGTVKLQITINHKGKVIAAVVKDKLGYGCDEEATRIVKLLRFTVKKNRNLRVTFTKNIQIHFNLPAQKSAQKTPNKGLSISYTYTTETPKKTDKPPTKTYTYKIG